ncbi:MAG TPA: ATP-binding cassette domain-containing protein [Bacteroidales bacterium]|nr:ATP-binding cassette domain-containing protein [Bacteroidales bacterium]
MDKLLLKYMMEIFAILAHQYPSLHFENVKDFIRTFILKNLLIDIAEKNINLFYDFYEKYRKTEDEPPQAHLEALYAILTQIAPKISQKQRFQILINLILFEKYLLKYTSNANDDINNYTDTLNIIVKKIQINLVDYINCRNFINQTLYNIPKQENLLLLAGKLNINVSIKYLQHNNLKGQIYFLFIESSNLLLYYYKGPANLSTNNIPIFENYIYIFSKGESIKGPDIEPVYYNQIFKEFISTSKQKLEMVVKDVEFRYKNSNNGIHRLSVKIESGQLIGIIGRSGTGKSTMLNILNGRIKPQQGSITINGLNFAQNTQMPDGLIGYIPQDDLLLEELTVFENLYINTQLCFSNLTPTELTDKVNICLQKLNLYNIKDLKVGSPLKQVISGGQRKKLNMALEFVREPWILLADEPTSGLSSSDSEEIMYHLAEFTYEGRIIVVNIHQPSSDLFKLFDKIIVLDTEGYPVYFGTPVDAIDYFNQHIQRYTSLSEHCTTCENVNPEAIFKAMEEKQVDDFGQLTNERKLGPKQWHQLYLNNIPNIEERAKGNPLPRTHTHKPSIIEQFIIFSKRNILSKLANKAYVLMAVLISPLLSALLAFLCRSGSAEGETAYSFGNNENMIAFLFMAVTVALFVGLIISAEEIIRDRKILRRESFLKLSKASYLHSKITYLFILSAVQTLLFVLISNLILEIKGMGLYFWLILFATSCFGNILGLLLSSIFKSVVVIYIMVPIVIIPQILLSGTIVNFSKLNKWVTSSDYVPLVGDLMVSRWAYEGLAVSQFQYNQYQKHYFDVEKQESNVKYNYYFLLPEIEKKISNIIETQKISQENVEFIKNALMQLSVFYDINEIIKSLDSVPSVDLITKTDDMLKKINNDLLNRFNALSREKDNITRKLINTMGSMDNLLRFKDLHYNKNIAELLLQRQTLKTFYIEKNNMYRQMEPVYQIPFSKTGRAQFLASSKLIGAIEVDTFTFNVIVIWIITLIVYLILFRYFLLNL